MKLSASAPAAPEGRPRGFWWLFVTQSQGAFSDNVLKWLVISLITGMGFSNDKRDLLVGVVGVLFAIPFILFSMAGGYFADHFSKRFVTIGVKVFEIFVMLLALAGLASNHLYLAIACIFLMEVHSAIFGPSKYGLLPERLPVIAAAIALGEMLTVLVLRAHYTMDVVAGALAAFLAAELAGSWSPVVDAWLR